MKDKEDRLVSNLPIKGIRLSAKAHEALKKIAKRECRTLVEQIRYFIEKGVERDADEQSLLTRHGKGRSVRDVNSETE